MASKFLFALLLAVSTTKTFVNSQAEFRTAPGYAASRYASVTNARGVVRDSAGDVLVVSKDQGRITAIYNQNNQGQTVQIISNKQNLGLNHGIAYHNGYLYASSDRNVYRWPYTAGARTPITANEQVVIRNIPPGGHWSRTLVLDGQGRLYVSIGSNANVDPNSDRARIRRFDISSIPNGGIDFNTGVVFADGLRNEVALAFDPDGVLWGAQNGADNLNRADLGGDIHNTNPAEELTKYDQALGTHYGYPYCWTVDTLNGHNRGDQFAWPTFMNDGVHTDAWCRNVNNNRPPTLAMPAHVAPLGMTFYDGTGCDSSPGAFPCSMRGDAFVGYHGSWNRNPPEGYKVVRIPINQQTKLPTGEIIDIMWEPNKVSCGRCFRPVDMTFDERGHLIVSADASSEVFRITYDGN